MFGKCEPAASLDSSASSISGICWTTCGCSCYSMCLLSWKSASCWMDTAVLSKGEIQAIVIPPTSEENESKGQKRNQEEIQDAKEDKAGGDADPITPVR